MNQKTIDARTHVDRSDEGLCEVEEACRQAMVGMESMGEGQTSRISQWRKILKPMKQCCGSENQRTWPSEQV